MNFILFEILNELERAEINHPLWPKCNIKRSAIMLEEAGEVIREANCIDEGKGSIENLKIELTQTAAMCIRMLKEIKNDDLVKS